MNLMSNEPWNDVNWICEYYFEFEQDGVLFKSNVETLDFMMPSAASKIEAELYATDVILNLYNFDFNPTLKTNCYEYGKSY